MPSGSPWIGELGMVFGNARSGLFGEYAGGVIQGEFVVSVEPVPSDILTALFPAELLVVIGRCVWDFNLCLLVFLLSTGFGIALYMFIHQYKACILPGPATILTLSL
jgi:hypothetical protein